jgi:hypothetical protein
VAARGFEKSATLVLRLLPIVVRGYEASWLQEDQKRFQNRLAETKGLRFLLAAGRITTVFVLLYFTGHG